MKRTKVANKKAAPVITKREEQQKPVIQFQHLLVDSSTEERTALLTQCFGQACTECGEEFIADSLLAHGRTVTLAVRNCSVDLRFCSHCTYFFCRNRVTNWKQRFTMKGAPLDSKTANDFHSEMAGPFAKYRLILVVIP